MEGWLRAIVAVAIGPVRELANAVSSRLSGIWSTIGRVFGGIRSAWGRLRARALAFLIKTRDALGEAYFTLRWLIFVRIPALLRNAKRELTEWVSQGIRWLGTELRKLIATLDKWAKHAVAAVTNSLRAFRDWALGKINALIADAARLVRRVFGDWSSPAKLAEWLVGALWGAFLRLVYSQRDRIASWFLRTSTAFTLWLARALESVIGRLM
jgi:hypothetical protein